MYIAFKSKNNNIGLNICLFFSIHINEFVLSPWSAWSQLDQLLPIGHRARVINSRRFKYTQHTAGFYKEQLGPYLLRPARLSRPSNSEAGIVNNNSKTSVIKFTLPVCLNFQNPNAYFSVYNTTPIKSFLISKPCLLFDLIFLCPRYNIMWYNVCQRLATGWCLFPGTPFSSTNKIDRHDIAEMLSKVALNTTTLTITLICMTRTSSQTIDNIGIKGCRWDWHMNDCFDCYKYKGL